MLTSSSSLKRRAASPSRGRQRKQPPASPSPLEAASKAENSADVAVEHRAELEFGGPIGALGIVFGLPVVIFLLFYVSNKRCCLTFDVGAFSAQDFVAQLPSSVFDVVTATGCVWVMLWAALQVALERVLPGECVEGVALKSGTRLAYTMSGHLQFWLTLAVLLFGGSRLRWNGDELEASDFAAFPLHTIYDHYLELAAASILLSAALSMYLYLSSFKKGALLAEGGDTGNAIYDFFIGRELNPRIGSLDLKQFCELRPGLIGWVVINIGMAWKQLIVNGSVSMSMLSIVLSQGLYVWDALYQEKAILTTMDITTDGFGYMLAFGDLAWVPFIYSLQSRYLVDFDPHFSANQCLVILGVQCLGYYIFRSANSEKDAFRRDCNSPEVAHLSFMQTKRGTKLITSGWWGAARKINYTGDWLITLSWCLLCGFKSPVPYFQALYFAILLFHRARRDDQMCAAKYGADWAEYKRRVPYLFVPGVF